MSQGPGAAVLDQLLAEAPPSRPLVIADRALRAGAAAAPQIRFLERASLHALLADVAPGAVASDIRHHVDAELFVRSEAHGLVWMRVTFVRGPASDAPLATVVVRRSPSGQDAAPPREVDAALDSTALAARGLVLVAGARHAGKTSILVTLASRVAARGRAVEIFGSDLAAGVDGVGGDVLARAPSIDHRLAALETMASAPAEVVIADDVGSAEEALALTTLALSGRLVIAAVAAGSVPSAIGRWLGPRGKGPPGAMLAEALTRALAMVPIGTAPGNDTARRAFEILEVDDAARTAIQTVELDALERLLVRA